MIIPSRLIAVIAASVVAGWLAVSAPAQAVTKGSEATAVDSATVVELSSSTQIILLGRANHIIADQPTPSISAKQAQVRLSSNAVAVETWVRDKIRSHRKWLHDRQEAYTAAHTSLEDVSATRVGNTIEMRAKEVTLLDYAKTRGDEPPSMGYTAEHVFVYSSNASGGWTLTEDRQLEPTGLLPLRVAVTFVSANRT